LEREFTTVTFHHVNVDQQSDLAQKYGVNGIPCIVITVDGKEKRRFVGVTGYQALSAELSKYCGSRGSS